MKDKATTKIDERIINADNFYASIMNPIEQIIQEVVEKGVFEAIGDGISIQDTNFKILYQNIIHKNMIGDHVKEYCYAAYGKKEQICTGCPLAETFKDGRIHTNERSAPTDKGTIYFEITSSPIKVPTGEIIAGIEVVRDISERKKIEEVLLKSSFYLDSISDTLIVINDKREIIKVNKEFTKLWGYAPEEVLDKSVFKLFPEEEISKHQSKMEEAISIKKSLHFETNALTKSGEKVSLSIRGSAIFDKDGKLEGFIGVFRDITEQKRMENELKNRIEDLEIFYNVAINRELKMKELIEENKKLKEKLLKHKK
jgi:PAS domain S-box-containing protein